jgi:TfoX/Sxy family transcriptional regulator of competence genes
MKKSTAPRTSRKPPAQKSSKASAKGARLTEIDPQFAPVAAAFADDGEVGLGKMFSSSSVLNVRGKIFAMLVKGKLVAKLPKERVAGLVASGAGEYFDPGHGRLMKEWVAVADHRPQWVALAREAHAFVSGARRD